MGYSEIGELYLIQKGEKIQKLNLSTEDVDIVKAEVTTGKYVIFLIFK